MCLSYAPDFVVAVTIAYSISGILQHAKPDKLLLLFSVVSSHQSCL